MKKPNRMIIYAGVSTILLIGIRNTETLAVKEALFAALFLVLILMGQEVLRRAKSMKNADR